MLAVVVVDELAEVEVEASNGCLQRRHRLDDRQQGMFSGWHFVPATWSNHLLGDLCGHVDVGTGRRLPVELRY